MGLRYENRPGLRMEGNFTFKHKCAFEFIIGINLKMWQKCVAESRKLNYDEGKYITIKHGVYGAHAIPRETAPPRGARANYKRTGNTHRLETHLWRRLQPCVTKTRRSWSRRFSSPRSSRWSPVWDPGSPSPPKILFWSEQMDRTVSMEHFLSTGTKKMNVENVKLESRIITVSECAFLTFMKAALRVCAADRFTLSNCESKRKKNSVNIFLVVLWRVRDIFTCCLKS